MKRTILKYLILLSTGYAFLRLLHWPIGFTFFTQLSNLYVALTVLFQLILPDNKLLRPVKYTAVVSIFITFLIYLLILAPMMPGGLSAAYRQDHYASLCLHILTPALSIADFFLNDTDYPWKKRHILYAAVPPVVYFVFILILGKMGVRWGTGNMAAPYLFLNYSAPAGWFGWMPENAGYTTMGIGVFYAVLAMLLLFLAVGAVILRITRSLSKVQQFQR